MSTVNEIESAISNLSPREFARLARWFDGLRDDRWDRQMKTDAKAGRLSKILAQVDADIDSGKATDFPRKK